jgi:glycosyltransferase involved in cell wall biosynthesis
MKFHDSVLPVLVLYKQGLTSSESLKTLEASLVAEGIRMDLFVYDNSPTAQYDTRFMYNSFDVHYKHDCKNSGVSLAYNLGASFAKEINKRWLLLLDQDTVFPYNFLDVYAKSVRAHPEVKLFAPILMTQYGNYFSPCRYKHKRGYWLPKLAEGLMDVRRFSPVNSGMLIDLKAFFHVGGYNEAVKLDFADFQFIERFGEKYNNFYVLNLVCNQDFSGFEKSVDKLKHRFSFFCEGAKNCTRRNLLDDFWYLVVVLRRMMGLIVKYKNLSFFFIFIRKYLF